jgi:hypothetical protein
MDYWPLYTFTLRLYMLIYMIRWPLGAALTVRLILTPRWLSPTLTRYWLICGVLVQLALSFSLPLADRLGAWYKLTCTTAQPPLQPTHRNRADFGF